MNGFATLVEALNADDAAAALRDLDERGALTRLLPELEAARGFKQPDLHHYDVLGHVLAAVEAFDQARGQDERGQRLRAATEWFDLDASLDREIEGLPLVSVLRLACLLHDVAKPATATVVEGRLRFPRHGPVGAGMAAERLPALGFGPEVTGLVAALVRQHLRPAELVRNHPATDRAVRKFVDDARGEVVGLMLLNLADGWATRGPGYTDEHFDRHCGFLNYVVARAWLVARPGPAPLLKGEDLMQELGLESGRLLGAVLTSVHKAHAEGRIQSRDEALAMARAIFTGLAG